MARNILAKKEVKTLSGFRYPLRCFMRFSEDRKSGLIFRQHGTTDKREVEIHLTPDRKKLVNKMANLHRNTLLGLHGIFKVPGVKALGHEL